MFNLGTASFCKVALLPILYLKLNYLVIDKVLFYFIDELSLTEFILCERALLWSNVVAVLLVICELDINGE